MAWACRGFSHGAASTSNNLNVAAGGEPAGAAAGDLVIAAIAYRSNAPFSVPAGGWSIVATQQSSGDTDATNGIASGIMAWIVRGSSPPDYVFTRTGGDVAIAGLSIYTGGHASTPYDTGTANTLGANSATVTTGTFNTAEDGELIVAMTAAGDTLTSGTFDAATDPSTASGTTEIGAGTAPQAGTWTLRCSRTTATGADCGVGMADAIRSAAGATGTIQATISASARHVMIAGAFKLAATGPPHVPPPRTFQPFLAQ